MTGAARPWAGVAAAALLLGGLTGCSQDDADQAVKDAREAVRSAADGIELPNVDWDKYGDDLKRQIDKAAKLTDCDELADQLVTYESASNEVTDYIRAKLREADC